MGVTGGDEWGDWGHFAGPTRPALLADQLADENVTSFGGGRGVRLRRTRADIDASPQPTPELLALRVPRR